MLLEVLLGWGDELDGGELEATLLEARDDLADEATLYGYVSKARPAMVLDCSECSTYLDTVRLDSDEAIYGQSLPLGWSWMAWSSLRLLGSHICYLLCFSCFVDCSKVLSVSGMNVLEDSRCRVHWELFVV